MLSSIHFLYQDNTVGIVVFSLMEGCLLFKFVLGWNWFTFLLLQIMFKTKENNYKTDTLAKPRLNLFCCPEIIPKRSNQCMFADLRLQKIKIAFILFYSAATTVRPLLQDHQPLLLAWRHHTCQSMLVFPPFQVPQSIQEIGASRFPLAHLLSLLPSLLLGLTLTCARSCTSIWPVSVQSSSRRARHHPREHTWEQLLFSKVPPTCMTLSNAVLTTWRAQMMVWIVIGSCSFGW